VSQAAIDFVQSAYQWGNTEGWKARGWWHEDGVYVNSREDPDHATHVGIDAIEALFASWVQAYPDLNVTPLEARANGERVFLWVRYRGQGASSGMPMDMELAHVLTLKDGLIKRLEEYTDRSEGLAAAGLQD
jgi:ketosteroid isomerase-like protein